MVFRFVAFHFLDKWRIITFLGSLLLLLGALTFYQVGMHRPNGPPVEDTGTVISQGISQGGRFTQTRRVLTVRLTDGRVVTRLIPSSFYPSPGDTIPVLIQPMKFGFDEITFEVD